MTIRSRHVSKRLQFRCPIESTFRIRWRTDEKSIAYVRYGPDRNYGLSSSIEAAYALDHEVVLVGTFRPTKASHSR